MTWECWEQYGAYNSVLDQYLQIEFTHYTTVHTFTDCACNDCIVFYNTGKENFILFTNELSIYPFPSTNGFLLKDNGLWYIKITIHQRWNDLNIKTTAYIQTVLKINCNAIVIDFLINSARHLPQRHLDCYITGSYW